MEHDAVLDRTNLRPPRSAIRTGDLVVNLDRRSVSVDDRVVHLTEKEYGVLELLSLHKGALVTKEMFLKHLYRGTKKPELKIIDVFVCKLRKKLAEGSFYIETVWGRGYVLRNPVISHETTTAGASVKNAA
jgi:two-component system, cell cycle response regulator CtrA